ncbi:Clp protease N-terminal domain-containing protein [Kribbella sp. NPDC049174]|uniref:Clp protease N-terminal domain-containing protein n=1 Tax=Kribbella sp. NPDC049174 TaxID=3364112 RepID=UPI003720EDE6
MWDRFTPEARRVIVAAQNEAEELGHGYIGDEHVLLGLLGDDAGSAQRFLREHGLDLAAARTDLLRLTAAGRIPQSRGDDAATLRAVGIDVGQVERQLKAAFGPDAVGEAVWRASRRPWWRGGGRRRNPLCGKPFLAKPALALAVEYADSRGHDAGPEHLLYGVLQDAADPFGAGLGRRGRKHLAQLGWSIGASKPAAALLAAHGLDPGRLRAQLSADLGSAP